MTVLERTTPVSTLVTARWPRRLALGAIAGPIVFTAAWLVLGFISPGYTVSGTRISPYSPITQPISGLGLGETAPYMNAAFILTGLLLLAGVIGIVRSLPPGGRPLARRAGAVLLAGTPLGFIVVAIFDLNALAMHLLGATMILATPVVSFLVIGLHLRAVPGWRRLGTALTVAAPVTLLLYIGYNLSFSQSATAAGHGVAGLTQRVLFVEILAWFIVLGVHARRSSR